MAHDPKAGNAPRSTPGKPASEPAAGDPAPVAVAGPEAHRRERPQPPEGSDTPLDPGGDPAPVAVAGPEAHSREKDEPAPGAGQSPRKPG